MRTVHQFIFLSYTLVLKCKVHFSQFILCEHNICLISPSLWSASQAASPEASAPSGGDRKKWETDGASLLSVAQQTLEETCLATAGRLTGALAYFGIF